MALLEATGISKRFGGLLALSDVSLRVHRGEIVGLIGPNGAGKTTLFNCISGLIPPDRGRIAFEGRDITATPPHARAWIGIGRTFQIVQTFGAMTVEDNLVVAAHTRTGSSLVSNILRLPAARHAERSARERARVVASFLGIEDLLQDVCGGLPLGRQRQVEVARALCLRPKLLMLDEAASGLDSAETATFAKMILRARETFGISILVVEHDVGLIQEVCDYAYVLDFGQQIAEGTPAEVTADAKVREAYLGSPGEEPVPVDVSVKAPVAASAGRRRKKEAVS